MAAGPCGPPVSARLRRGGKPAPAIRGRMQARRLSGSVAPRGPRNRYAMRIGLVVDSACDLPAAYYRQHNISLLPVTIHIGEDSLTDLRDEQDTLQLLQTHIP